MQKQVRVKILKFLGVYLGKLLAIANRNCFKPEMFDLLFFAEEWFKQYETVESLKTVDTLLGEDWKVERIFETGGSFGSWKEPWRGAS